MRKPLTFLAAPILGFAMIAGTGCETAPKTEAKRENLLDEGETALKSMQNVDSTLSGFVNRAYGYAIFPNVGKGGLVAGGAYGKGSVYEQGKFIGYSDLRQGTVGLQAGGQNFSELVVFENKAALDKFIGEKFEFAANASAVALKPGVSKSASFDKGVAVFTQPKGGLMFEAAIGGQQFTFVSADRVGANDRTRMTETETKTKTIHTD
jgi:lipid-binding SYLF domain-containing protein